jgi:hypothetical protein
MKTRFIAALTAVAISGCSQGQEGNATQTAAQPPSETGTAAAGAGHVDPPGTPAHSHGEEKAGMNMAMMAPAPNDTPATRSYKQSMATMMQSMPAYTQDADVDFNKQMKIHHQAAIDMAEVQLANGKDPASKALAQKIIADQRKEIAQIDAWLQQRGP